MKLSWIALQCIILLTGCIDAEELRWNEYAKKYECIRTGVVVKGESYMVSKFGGMYTEKMYEYQCNNGIRLFR